MTDMIRYFGARVAYGPDCAPLPDDTELVVEVIGGMLERMTAEMMIGYANSAAYPVAYQLAGAA